jgi:hypothetical protein
MTDSLSHNIHDVMRTASRRTSVDALRREGRKSVSVLTFRDVEQLIANAVESTLERRGIQVNTDGMHAEVKVEFLSLMRERDQPRPRSTN